MSVMQVERVQGEYSEPEIIDLEDGCLVRIHEEDISEDGVKALSKLLAEQAKRWEPRPAGSHLGPIIPVRWIVSDLPAPFVIGVEDSPASITYTIDSSVLTHRAAVRLGRLGTALSPRWHRVPEGCLEGQTRSTS